MKIKEFKNYETKIKFFPEFQCPLYFGGGEFLENCDEKSIIYSNLCNPDFLNKINSKLVNKISLDTDISNLKLTNIFISADYGFPGNSLKEMVIPDGNHEGDLYMHFNIEGVSFECKIINKVKDVNRKTLLESCSYIDIYEGYINVKLQVV